MLDSHLLGDVEPIARKIQRIASESAARVLVGYPSGRQHATTHHENRNMDGTAAGDEAAIDTADLAAMLSYGTEIIPPRPFLEEGIMAKKDALKNELKVQVLKIVEGESPAFEKLGTMAVGAVQEFVRSDYYKTNVPNAPATIEYKGSDMPLIDGGDLVNSCQFIIQKGE